MIKMTQIVTRNRKSDKNYLRWEIENKINEKWQRIYQI